MSLGEYVLDAGETYLLKSRSQWKRAVTAAAITACNGLGGIAGSFIVRQNEAPTYSTAIWVSIGCDRVQTSKESLVMANCQIGLI